MGEMHSLLVTRMSPFPATAGVPLRVAGALYGLSTLGPVDVIVIGAEVADDDVPDYIAEVTTVDPGPPSARSQLTGRLGGRHPLAASLWTPDIDRLVRSRAAGPDLVVLEEVWLAPYLDAAAAGGARVVYDSHNVETVLRREIASLQATSLPRRIRRSVITSQVSRLERQLVEGADQVWACSEQDRQAMASLFGRASSIRVVPNAIDAVSVAADVARADLDGDLDGNLDGDLDGPGPRVLFLGDLRYPPNEDGALFLLDEIMPQVRERVPGAELLLVGRNPTERLRRTASPIPWTTVTGEVASVAPYLAAADVLAVTLRIGGGTRLKILEGLAAGLPIVTTTKGVEGIDAVDGVHLAMADEPTTIADRLTEVLTDRALADRRRRAGRALVDDHYSWTAVAERIRHHVQGTEPTAETR